MTDEFKYGLRWWKHYPKEKDKYFCSKWEPSSFEEMKSGIFNDLFPAAYGKIKPGIHTYLHDGEEAQSINAYKKGITDYDPVLNTFNYYVNDFGFRGRNQPIFEDRNISFFGCSFTFGVGLPYEDHYVQMIGEKLKTNVLNFGIPGAGISRIARIFYLISKFQKMDLAVFNMPHFSRLEYPLQYKQHPTIVNIITNYRHLSPEEDAIRIKISEALSEDYLTFDFLKNLTFIENVAKLRNIKTVYTSWDVPVHDLLSTYFADDQDKLLPWFQFVEYKDTLHFKKARDGAHPGRESSRVFTERSAPYIEKLLNG